MAGAAPTSVPPFITSGQLRYQSQNWFGELVQNARGDIEAEAVQRVAVRFNGLVEFTPKDPAVAATASFHRR